MKKLYFVIFALVFQSSYGQSPEASNFDPYDPSAKAVDSAAALMHFGQLVGKWKIEQQNRSQDGQSWNGGRAADWNFYWIMGGRAIQDDWVTPSVSEKDVLDSERSYGTNIRTYDSENQVWNIAWMVSGGKPVMAITAQSTESEIVMLVVGQNSQGFFRRITFFGMKQDSFEWKQEWSEDGKDKWFEVARIHGVRQK
jgi:hypothetical protein